MAKKKSYKKMTNAEKKARKELRDKLREEGIIPPIKPRLNRKNFRAEVLEEFKEFRALEDLLYVNEAISWMVAGSGKVTAEQVGVLKTLKLAMDIKRFKERKLSDGETSYAVDDFYQEVVTPIINL